MSTLGFLDFTFDADTLQLLRDSQPVSLDNKLSQCLSLLLRQPGTVVSRELFFAELWPNTQVGEATLNQLIYRLRRILGDTARRPHIIKTVPQLGYRFIAPAHTISAPQHPPMAAALRRDVCFVGRHTELAQLQDTAHRLLNIQGLGGIGKTALAREFVAQRFATAWFCDGRGLSDLPALYDQLAQLLQVSVSPKIAPERLGAVLATYGSSALILDAVDDIPGLEAVCQSWLKMAPMLHILITSRRPVAFHAAYRLHLHRLPSDESQALLFKHIHQRRSDFQVSSNNQAVFDVLLARLEGYPPAILLAALHLHHFSLRFFVARLTHGIISLKVPTLPLSESPLQTNFANLYAWLSSPQQQLLRRLSVFIGGATLEALAAVTALPRDGFEAALADLIQQGVLVLKSTAGEPRYDTMRMFAEVLTAQLEMRPDEASEARALYTEYYARFATGLVEHCQERQWMGSRCEQHNLTRALELAEIAGDSEAATQCALGLVALHRRQGNPDAAIPLLIGALNALPLSAEDEGRLRVMLGQLLLETSGSEEMIIDVLQKLPEMISPGLTANALRIQGLLCSRHDQWEVGQRLYQSGLNVARHANQPGLEAELLMLMAINALFIGEGKRARMLHLQAVRRRADCVEDHTVLDYFLLSGRVLLLSGRYHDGCAVMVSALVAG